MRRVALLITGGMAAVCAAYTVIYLVRWEWNRALIAAMFFLAVEVVMVGAILFERLRRLEARFDELPERAEGRDHARDAADGGDPTLEALQTTAPDLPDRFGWIRDQANRTNVFLPILLGAGVVASALAFLVEHVARATVTSSMERRLALRMGALAAPAGGLLGVPAPRPAAIRRRTWKDRGRAGGIAVLLMVGALGTAAGIDFVADRTQTRPGEAVAGVNTTVDLQLQGTTAGRDPERIMGHLWAACTAPNVIPGRGLPEPSMYFLGGGHVRVTFASDLASNYADRLRGCLNDATITRVQARVLSITAS